MNLATDFKADRVEKGIAGDLESKKRPNIKSVCVTCVMTRWSAPRLKDFIGMLAGLEESRDCIMRIMRQ